MPVEVSDTGNGQRLSTLSTAIKNRGMWRENNMNTRRPNARCVNSANQKPDFHQEADRKLHLFRHHIRPSNRIVANIQLYSPQYGIMHGKQQKNRYNSKKETRDDVYVSDAGAVETEQKCVNSADRTRKSNETFTSHNRAKSSRSSVRYIRSYLRLLALFQAVLIRMCVRMALATAYADEFFFENENLYSP